MAYADHAATTAMRPAALAALTESAVELGNPSSLHSAGRRSRRIVEESRESIADRLGVRPSDVVFTSGGTEADNLAIKGLLGRRRCRSRSQHCSRFHNRASRSTRRRQWLVDHEGARVEWIPAGINGQVDVDWLAERLARDASHIALCAVMWANNETGVVQPVESIAAMCEEYEIPFHCDGVQAVAWLPEPALAKSEVLAGDLRAQVRGPVGVGALVVNGVTPHPLFHGGGRRSTSAPGRLPLR